MTFKWRKEKIEQVVFFPQILRIFKLKDCVRLWKAVSAEEFYRFSLFSYIERLKEKCKCSCMYEQSSHSCVEHICVNKSIHWMALIDINIHVHILKINGFATFSTTLWLRTCLQLLFLSFYSSWNSCDIPSSKIWVPSWVILKKMLMKRKTLFKQKSIG